MSFEFFSADDLRAAKRPYRGPGVLAPGVVGEKRSWSRYGGWWNRVGWVDFSFVSVLAAAGWVGRGGGDRGRGVPRVGRRIHNLGNIRR